MNFKKKILKAENNDQNEKENYNSALGNAYFGCGLYISIKQIQMDGKINPSELNGFGIY